MTCDTKDENTTLKTRGRGITPAHNWRPFERCGKHTARRLTVELAVREGTTTKHPQVNENCLRNSRFKLARTVWSSADRLADRSALPEAASRLSRAPAQRPAVGKHTFLRARVGPKLRASLCRSFPSSRGHETGRQKELVWCCLFVCVQKAREGPFGRNPFTFGIFGLASKVDEVHCA